MASNLSHVRHLAHQIVAQLPEDTNDALLVLEYARRLMLIPLDDYKAEAVPLKIVDKK
jgi:hypothetical protein